MPNELKRANELASMKGSSNWLNSLPLKSEGYNLNNDVVVEPPLMPLTGERFSANIDDEARLDICARSFWMQGEQAFFDVRIINPFASTHLNQSLTSSFVSIWRMQS